MSDYRRFIAYLYEYPNNRKGGCCGFVRVESQNGFCRMDFQIKSPSLPPETSVTVYGLSAGQGGCTAFRSEISLRGALLRVENSSRTPMPLGRRMSRSTSLAV